VEMDLGGRPISLETGKMARQAGGSVIVSYGGTVVLSAATGSERPREGVDFLPLTVDYEERLYAVGRIPGSWTRREGRPHDKAILAARLADRGLRPLFPEGQRRDVQVVNMVLSVEQDNAPEICAINGASAALMLSEIPFMGPIGAVEVGMVDGRLIVNPTHEETQKSLIRLTVAGTRDAVLMVEAEAREVSEDQMLKAIALAHDVIRDLCDLQMRLVQEAGRGKVDEEAPGALQSQVEPMVKDYLAELIETPQGIPPAKSLEDIRGILESLRKEHPDEDINQAFKDVLASEIKARVPSLVRGVLREGIQKAVEVSRSGKADGISLKKEREARLDRAQDDAWKRLAPLLPGWEKEVRGVIYKTLKTIVRRMMLDEEVRIDGRSPTEVRPIWCGVGVLPRTHGSALFTRGETQVLTVGTLGAVGDVQMLDDVDEEEYRRFMHHYNFPPFSVGEARPMRGPGRREIGHGALASKAIEAVLPDEESFPYTIRLVSEVLESNGSTSMASVCGSCLCLMDAGVPIKAPVAGVAMGLVKEDDKVVVLTDIQGIEDALGDMDFKVAGTGKGITALQMDVKNTGIGHDVLAKALEQAREGRLHILARMLKTISEPRQDLSPHAPRIISLRIDPERIRDIIGPGGKVIQKLQADTNTKIDVEQDGRVFISASDPEGGARAEQAIRALTAEVTPGEIYTGKVTRLMNFGAFVEILPNKEGLVHISELAEGRVGRVEDVVAVGDEVVVKVLEIDRLGRINLSRRQALKGPDRGDGCGSRRS
jgi:polyribonucleotide nucleotidyltransferase